MQENEKKLYHLRGLLQELYVSDTSAKRAEKLIKEAILSIEGQEGLAAATKEKLASQLCYEITHYLKGEYGRAATNPAKTVAFNRAKENAIRWISRALQQLDNT